VVTNHLLASPLPATEVVGRGDCLGAFQREFDYLCRTLRRLGIPASDIEDLAHEVFLVLHRRWEDYDPSCALRPWLFGIAFRVAASHRRRSAREVPRGWIDVEDSGREPDQAIAAAQARTIVLAALEQVPLARRAVLVMHDLDDASMQEIASALSIPLFTAYSRLRKARKEFETAVRQLQKRAIKR
jgi:RNA polymerase sigma-70 factor (ECF subfamily)